MKPHEKLMMLTGFTVAWIGLWATGPETPGDKYSSFDVAVFAAGLIACFILAVRFWSQHIQRRDAERLKKVLRRRDARPRR